MPDPSRPHSSQSEVPPGETEEVLRKDSSHPRQGIAKPQGTPYQVTFNRIDPHTGEVIDQWNSEPPPQGGDETPLPVPFEPIPATDQVTADQVIAAESTTADPPIAKPRIAKPPIHGDRMIGLEDPTTGAEQGSQKKADPANQSIPSTDPAKQERSPSTKPAVAAKRSDSLFQSFGMLATMTLMLLAARYVVPSIVEEIRYAWHRGELRAEYESGTEGLRNVSLESLSDAYEMVTAAVGPSVVHIDVERSSDERFPKSLRSSSSDQGSGVIVDSDGYIVTNRHVISDGQGISVTLSDGRRVPASIVGTDLLTDLAVLKVDSPGEIPIAWGNSDRCRVGSPVWAVGSPFGLDRTVTFGILSGKHRKVRASTEWQDFMQSDVAVNPGNSGGPLVDARGTLVGINTAIVGDTYQGVSFSVPSNVVRQVYERIRSNGRVERGWLGVSLTAVSDSELVGGDPRMRGAKVGFLPDQIGPAAKSGVIAGDIVLGVDGTAVRDRYHLMQLIAQAGPGEKIVLEIFRSGRRLEIPIVLDTRPDLES